MNGNCEICDKEIEVQMCCNGRDCCCMGLPVEPPVCSRECFDKYIIGMNEKKLARQKKDNLRSI